MGQYFFVHEILDFHICLIASERRSSAYWKSSVMFSQVMSFETDETPQGQCRKSIQLLAISVRLVSANIVL